MAACFCFGDVWSPPLLWADTGILAAIRQHRINGRRMPRIRWCRFFMERGLTLQTIRWVLVSMKMDTRLEPAEDCCEESEIACELEVRKEIPDDT